MTHRPDKTLWIAPTGRWDRRGPVHGAEAPTDHRATRFVVRRGPLTGRRP
ncbi:hypothetical protein HMPREF0321_2235 [Dermacoccus sp. Ellin185]|nr:hypothetical protein HMPREF0321_2235 [Dermacoccus sp. Ellin185]